LAAIVKGCLGGIPENKERRPAVMVPHAGLQYSGRIAGDVLKKVEIPDTVIVIGPKHTRNGVDWAVAPHETWQLPGTTMASDTELARLLADRIEGLQLDAAAHAQEHCIEVELPLIQHLSPEAKVVGIVIGGGSLDGCRRFGQQLAAVIREMESAPLLVISSDMNHFASDEENRRLDEMALVAMESLDSARLFETVTLNSITMCGVLPAVIVMETLRELGQLSRIQRVSYATSGDVSGDLSRVVGYAGMLLG
jgi:AmmeMemoRadiSam system protein B